MKSSRTLIALTLLALAFVGCSKKESAIDLGVIELTPDVPKHIKIGEMTWTITEKRLASGKLTITAESPEWKVTQKDIANSFASPEARIGSTMSVSEDWSNLPRGVQITAYFGRTLARYTLKADAN